MKNRFSYDRQSFIEKGIFHSAIENSDQMKNICQKLVINKSELTPFYQKKKDNMPYGESVSQSYSIKREGIANAQWKKHRKKKSLE